MTWQALIQRFVEVLVCWHADGEDICGPGLDMSCLTIAASELGTFFNPQDREMVDVLVDLWDGRRGRFERTTLSSGTKIARNPWLNLIACTTPRWISEHLSAHFTGGGFSSRSVFVYAETKRRLVAYPFLEMGDREVSLRADLLHDLKRVASLYGAFKLTDEALDFGKAIYEADYKKPPTALTNEQLLGYLARKQTHYHKLAMVLAAAESDSLVIERRHLESAVTSLESIEADMPKVFRQGKPEPISGLQGAVLAVISELKKVPRDELFRYFYHSVGIESFNAALTAVIAANYAVLRQEGTATFLEINPSISQEVRLRLVKGE